MGQRVAQRLRVGMAGEIGVAPRYVAIERGDAAVRDVWVAGAQMMQRMMDGRGLDHGMGGEAQVALRRRGLRGAAGAAGGREEQGAEEETRDGWSPVWHVVQCSSPFNRDRLQPTRSP